MKRQNGWKKGFAILALGGLMLAAPQLANADIASDIAAGKNATVVAQTAIKGGMAPVKAALAAAQALVTAKADSQSAVELAVALAQENPKQAVDIIRTVAALYPDRAQDITVAAAKTICSDNQKEKFAAGNKQDLLDVCGLLTPEIEAYEDHGNRTAIIDPPPFNDIRNHDKHDNQPASGI